MPDAQARADHRACISTGVDVADLRVLPSAVNRHLLKTENFDAGVHIGVNAADPEVVAIQFYERPGIQLTAALQKEIEKHFTRHEARRVGAADVGTISYPARAADELRGRPALRPRHRR